MPLFRLEQEPELQGALVSIDPHRQYLVAMVGGYDFDASEFNRAFQACRQPGSTFKPLVYSAAIEKLEWTPATVLVDAPSSSTTPSIRLLEAAELRRGLQGRRAACAPRSSTR